MSKRKQQRRSRSSSAGAALLRELGLGLLAIPSVALGLLLIAVFFQVAAENSEGVGTAVIAFGLALAATGLGALLVGWVATLLLGPAAVGWLAMFSGQRPVEFGPGENNLGRGLANLAFAAIAAGLGLLLFRHGVTEGEQNWAIEGLFLAATALVLGLIPAVPRLYFAKRGAARQATEEVSSDGVIGFVVAAAVGIGLSLALCFGVAEGRPQTGERALRPGTWHTGCVTGKQFKGCVAEARFTLVAREAELRRDAPPSADRWRLTLEQRGQCASVKLEAGDERPLREVPWSDLRRAQIKTYFPEHELRVRALDVAAGQRILLRVTTSANWCTFKVRYLPRAPRPQPGGGAR